MCTSGDEDYALFDSVAQVVFACVPPPQLDSDHSVLIFAFGELLPYPQARRAERRERKVRALTGVGVGACVDVDMRV